MLAVCGALAACGYKGPLYMPGSPQDHPRPVPPPPLKPGESATPAAPTTQATPSKASANTSTDDTQRTEPVPDLFQQ